MSGRDILVVDDDEMILLMISEVLRFEGFGVVLSKNGKEALERLENGRFDLIILDMRMPVMDGWEFMNRLRGGAPGTGTSVLIMSAYQQAENIAHEVGATGSIQKPFGIDELLGAVNKTLQAGRHAA